jgi:SagB-type dehydrogenase family enzyme
MKSHIGIEFIEKTKYQYVSQSDQTRGVEQPPLEQPYAGEGKLIDLPEPKTIELPDFGLRHAIEQRRSHRTFSRHPLTINELSYLLWCTQGVQRAAPKVQSTGYETLRTFRTVPSAGARHAFETYLFINHVDDLPAGLYRFLALEHKLVEVDGDDAMGKKISRACLDQNWMENAGVIFIWVADVYRMAWRYTERGYRYMFYDAGHVCQNLYLVAESIGCGACAIGAYDDDAMNGLLNLDGIDQFVIYLATVGKKPQVAAR